MKTVVAVLKGVRHNIDSRHKSWHDAAVTLGRKVNAPDPQLPRRCSVQTSRSNTPGDTPEIYYRRIVSIPFVDELISHLETRFSDIQEKAILGLRLVIADPSIPSYNSQDILNTYGDILPCPSSLEAELDLWKHKWQSQSTNTQMPD